MASFTDILVISCRISFYFTVVLSRALTEDCPIWHHLALAYLAGIHRRSNKESSRIDGFRGSRSGTFLAPFLRSCRNQVEKEGNQRLGHPKTVKKDTGGDSQYKVSKLQDQLSTERCPCATHGCTQSTPIVQKTADFSRTVDRPPGQWF